MRWRVLGPVEVTADGQLGDHTTALSECARALALFQQLDHMIGQAISWDGLGYAHHATGDISAARHAWKPAPDVLTSLDHPDADNLRGKLRRP
jgi:hypothetical protein